MVFPPHPLNSVRPRVRVRVRVTITLRPNNVWEERENSTSAIIEQQVSQTLRSGS